MSIAVARTTIRPTPAYSTDVTRSRSTPDVSRFGHTSISRQHRRSNPRTDYSGPQDRGARMEAARGARTDRDMARQG
jgi:hypothetical protein